MTDWISLGEVPDSEDEDAFDSQDSAANPEQTTTSTHEATVTKPHDIWEFPDSQNAAQSIHGLPSPQGSLCSSPLSSAQSVDGVLELDDMLLDDKLSGVPEDLSRESSTGSISRRIVIELKSRPSTPMSGTPLNHHAPPPVTDEDTALPSQELGLLETTQDLRREAVRLERSLRPRKPIQEHPYLLENAQYSSLIRQHGMRPVYMAAARVRAAQDENGQDEEFEDDSQENSFPIMNNLNQPNINETNEDRDIDMFDFPSSSPPKTSPWVSHQQNSNHGSSQDDTDDTSVPDQDLPALNELLSKPCHRISPSNKRSNGTPGSSARKRRKYDIIESDPVDSGISEQDTHVSSVHDPTSGTLPPIPRLQHSRGCAADISLTKTVVTIDNSSSPEREGKEAEERQEQPGSTSDKPVSESVGYQKRIKGVLPASWLRLDQKASRDKAQKHVYGRQRYRTPEKEVRRGLAQTRSSKSNQVAATVPVWTLDESDDEDTILQRPTTESTYYHQSRIILVPEKASALGTDELSDESSIIEHDTIDGMFSGRTQRRSSTVHGQYLKKAGNTSRKATSTKPRQQKITACVNGPKSTPSRRLRPQHTQKQASGPSSFKKRSISRPAPKPLSVLDVIEPDAPRFLRIAARTAKSRVNQGRSSPSKKMLRLSSRTDHLDAITTLNRWKSGSIPQRPAVSEARREKKKQAATGSVALRARSQQTPARNKPRPTKTSTNKLRKFVKQTSSGGSTLYMPSNNPRNSVGSANTVGTSYDGALVSPLEELQSIQQSERAQVDSVRLRPALLEMEQFGNVAPVVFHQHKQLLDRIYRHGRRNPSVTASNARSEVSVDRLSTANSTRFVQRDGRNEDQSKKKPTHRVRPKKPQKPVRIDVDAPQFRYAADPLPASYAVDIEPERPQTANAGVRLAGLGPYGTQYTTHFEIFPLDQGVYFHQSTLLGSGILEGCQKARNRQLLLSSRPRVIFRLGADTCHWGDWDARTSAQLGTLIDLMADELERTEERTTAREIHVLEASKFLATFATTALHFTDESSIKTFIGRVLDVVGNFHNRLSSLIGAKALSDGGSRTATRVYDGLLILVLVTLMICTEDNDLMTEKFQVEDLLRSLAAGALSNLLLMGIEPVQESYMQLQRNTVRERGIHDDEPAIHSWSLVMQILDISHIPRGSFWDVVKQALALKDLISVAEVQSYERVWETMFTMLPLSEFGSSGILIHGKRHTSSSDGWTIVQPLLRQVFTIYQENNRQAPGFNNYCRALIGRCHYLVQQWGWQRSGSIIGTMFDFFGSQNLEHLRNEEVNASPKFLESLAERPSLTIEPGDQCFHLFLKLLALSIQKLRAAGAINDIRNLVARIIPNHNRQHLKEQTVHERDLAALRNHHDLLATLYWAAPPDLRPPPALIERLVAPETSHKEASLINIRCWNQLSRFVVAKGEAATAFKPFHAWRNAFFQKMVQQFDSAAADIQQQLFALPSEVRLTVSEDVISSMISMNKEAVGDVLRASIAASLDVMKHAVDLEAATFCLNTLQLQHIYYQFGIYPPELNWNTLRAAVSTLDLFVGYVTDFKENEESQQSESQLLNSAQADDALLQLDREVSKRYFHMVRCVMPNNAPDRGSVEPYGFGGIEQAVDVAVRLAANFISGGLIQLQDLFKRGKYGLFDGPIYKMDFDRRQFLVLTVAILLKAGIDNFADVEFTLCELWLLVLVRPSHGPKHEKQLADGYEKRLADVLRQRGEYFLPAADIGQTGAGKYERNASLFEFAISAMRGATRDGDASLKRSLTAEYSRALKLVMEQMKEDLRAASSQPATHVAYVAFVRRIISLIRTHGSEICAVDGFYYQISKDYSPSVGDPQLQIAAMVSYGLRLRDGDPKVIQQVFFFLFNNFKLALTSDGLQEEQKKIRKGMAQDRGITQFIIGKMLPAILEATASKAVAYPLMDLYVWVVARRLSRFPTAYRLTDVDLAGVKAVLQAVLKGIDEWIVGRVPLTATGLHIFRTFFAAINLLWPSIYDYSLCQDELLEPWSDIMDLIETLNQYVMASRVVIDQEGFRSSRMRFDEIFVAAPVNAAQISTVTDEDVRGFAENIRQDIDRSWFEADGRISIQMPGKPRGGGALQGVLQPRWDEPELVEGVIGQLSGWLRWKKKMDLGGDNAPEGSWPETPMF